MAFILILDPNPEVRDHLAYRFRKAGLETLSASHFAGARRLMGHHTPDLALIDVLGDTREELLPLKQIREAHPEVKVIAMTGIGSVDTLVQSMKLGAVDFLQKPFSPVEIIDKVLQHLEDRGPASAVETDKERIWNGVVGRSPAIRNIRKLIEGIAAGDKPVLISGESGAGKTFFATLIHEISGRAAGPLHAVNCAAFSEETVLEQELFGGCERTSGALMTGKEGLMEKTDGGTLILEEVASLSSSIQARLVGYLQTGEIRHPGGHTPVFVDTRLIATTHNGLENLLREGRFRADLYFRLRSFALEIPPLRERGEDIPLLIKHLLKKLHHRGGPRYRITKEALSLLCALPYPGNVLELKNILGQITMVCQGELIDAQVLRTAAVPTDPRKESAPHRVARAEREIIAEVINRHPRDLDAAAKELGISRTTLWRRMKKYGLISKNRGAEA